MFGWLTPVPVDVEVTAREGGRVQLRVGGIAVKVPAEVAFRLSDAITDAAEQATQNKEANQ